MSSAAPRAPGDPSDPPDEAIAHARSRGFRADLLHTTAVNIGLAGTNAVTGIMVARLLRPGGRGELAAILNVPTLLGVLACLGLPDALVYFTSRRRDRAGTYLGTALVLTLSASVAFVAIGWAAMPWLLDAQSPDIVAGARWYLLQVPVAAVIGLVLRPLRGIGEHRWWNYLRIIPTAIWLLVLVGATTVHRVEPPELAFAFVALRALSIPVFVGVVRWRLRQPFTVERGLARPLLRYGAPNVLAVLPSELNYRLDQLLLAAFLPSGALGIYVVAVAWSQLQSPVLLAFGALLFPRIAGDADRAAQRLVVGGGVRTAVLVASVSSVGAALLTPFALPLLFGRAFEAAVPTAVLLTLAAGIAGVNLVAQEAARGLGHPRAVLVAQVAGLAATMAALAALLPGMRIFGAAIASVIGYSVVGLVLTRELRSATGASLRELLVPRRSDAVRVIRVLRHTGGAR